MKADKRKGRQER